MSGYRLTEIGTWHDKTHVCVGIEIDKSIRQVELQWRIYRDSIFGDDVGFWTIWSEVRIISFKKGFGNVRLEHDGPVQFKFLIFPKNADPILHYVSFEDRDDWVLTGED